LAVTLRRPTGFADLEAAPAWTNVAVAPTLAASQDVSRHFKSGRDAPRAEVKRLCSSCRDFSVGSSLSTTVSMSTGPDGFIVGAISAVIPETQRDRPVQLRRQDEARIGQNRPE
jgi:hypothetical protein